MSFRYLESEGVCPMCGTSMPAHNVTRLDEEQVRGALASAAGLQSENTTVNNNPGFADGTNFSDD